MTVQRSISLSALAVQHAYRELDEPVAVLHHGRVVGIWTPADAEARLADLTSAGFKVKYDPEGLEIEVAKALVAGFQALAELEQLRTELKPAGALSHGREATRLREFWRVRDHLARLRRETTKEAER